MSFDTQVTLAKDSSFRMKVKLAAFKAAVAVAAEKLTASKDTLFSKRNGLAFKILRSWDQTLEDGWAFAVATNATVTAASSDNDIEFTVNSMYNAMAGVTGQEV